MQQVAQIMLALRSVMHPSASLSRWDVVVSDLLGLMVMDVTGCWIVFELFFLTIWPTGSLSAIASCISKRFHHGSSSLHFHRGWWILSKREEPGSQRSGGIGA